MAYSVVTAQQACSTEMVKSCLPNIAMSNLCHDIYIYIYIVVVLNFHHFHEHKHGGQGKWPMRAF